MVQIYLLAVICPLVSGWMLVKDAGQPQSFERVFNAGGGALSCRLVAGISAAVTGVLALLSPIEGDIRLIGDLLPAAASLASGLALIESERSGAKDGGGARSFVFEFLAAHRKKIGIASMITAAIHFLLPRALFL